MTDTADNARPQTAVQIMGVPGSISEGRYVKPPHPPGSPCCRAILPPHFTQSVGCLPKDLCRVGPSPHSCCIRFGLLHSQMSRFSRVTDDMSCMQSDDVCVGHRGWHAALCSLSSCQCLYNVAVNIRVLVVQCWT